MAPKPSLLLYSNVGMSDVVSWRAQEHSDWSQPAAAAAAPQQVWISLIAGELDRWKTYISLLPDQPLLASIGTILLGLGFV